MRLLCVASSIAVTVCCWLPCEAQYRALSLEESDSLRVLYRNEWIGAADTLVARTKDKEAERILNFVKANGVLCSPHGADLRAIGESNSNTWFAVLPLLTSDAVAHRVWADILSNPSYGAIFFPDDRTLAFFPGRPCSEVWKGILLLHEGRHAMEYITSPYDWKDLRTFCIHERDVHAFQNRLAELVGGDTYRKAVEREASRLDSLIGVSGHKVGQVWVETGSYQTELDRAFGSPLSDIERKYRQTSLWIHANFLLLERKFDGDVEEQKALFLRSVYRDAGTLPR